MPRKTSRIHLKWKQPKEWWQSPLHDIQCNFDAIFVHMQAQLQWRKRVMDLTKEVNQLKEQVETLSNRWDK